MSLCCKIRHASIGANRVRPGSVHQQLSGTGRIDASRLQSVRTKRTSSGGGGGGGKATPIVGSGAARSRSMRKMSKSSKDGGGDGGGAWVFGLRPVNYNKAPPPEICYSPPPPPPKPGLAKYTFPISVAVMLGVTAYFYVNNQNDSFEYWEAMQTGTVPDDDDDDDDDFDDEDEE